jgi:hypothetical protein
VSLGYPKAPAPIEPPAPAIARPLQAKVTRFDVFLSHASEDKETIASRDREASARWRPKLNRVHHLWHRY